MRASSRITWAALILALFGCSDRGPATLPAALRDTTLVFTKGDGAWGPAYDAEIVFRVPSTSKETTFGVAAIVARKDGGVLVVDLKGAEGRIVRAFDSTGTFERNYGREGGGPGEYNNNRISIAEAVDGTVLVRDGARAISRFARNGNLLASFALGGRDNWMGLVGANDGTILTFAGEPQLQRNGSRPGLATVVRLDTTGRVIDTLRPLSWMPGDTIPGIRVGPRQHWYPLRDGRAVIGRQDRLAVLITDARGERPPVLAELPSIEISLSSEAIAEREAQARQLPPSAGAVERVMRPAGYIMIDADERIWLQKMHAPYKGPARCSAYGGAPAKDQPAPCIAKSTTYYRWSHVVFDTIGQFLGEVRFPDGTHYTAAVRDFAWGLSESEDGELLLTRFRIRRAN